MLSRVADAIYWMNRYVERAENVARFIDANFQMILDLPVADKEQWRPLVNTTGDHALFAQLYGEASRDHVIQFLTYERRNPNSILACLQAARENARSVREYISSEMWQQINSFYLDLLEAQPKGAAIDQPHQLFVDIMTACQTFVGVADNSMSHGEGWHFGRLGRMLERADKTSRILDVKYYILLPSVDYVGSPYDSILWAALLRSASAFEMYRKQYGRIESEPIVEFLLLDRQFPRAVHFCLIAARGSLSQITGSPKGSFANLAEQVLGRMLAEMDYTTVKEVLGAGLHEYLSATQDRINRVGQAVEKTFFISRPPAESSPPTMKE